MSTNVTNENCLVGVTINKCNDILCEKCGRVIKDGEAIVQNFKMGFHIGGFYRRIINCCEACGLPLNDTRLQKLNCDYCGRTFYKIRNGRMARHTFCSHRCEYSYYNHKRAELRKECQTKTCLVCGIVISGQRSDSKYCSNACRQKHYRIKGNSPDC